MSTPRTTRPRVLVLGLAAGLTTLTMAGSFGPTAAAEDATGVAKALAESSGISVGAATEQLATEAALSSTAAELDSALTPSEQAGSWIEGEDLVVAVTSDAAAEQVRAAGATPKLVERSQVELDTVQAKIDRLAQSEDAGGVVSWGIDPRSNAVTMSVTAGADDAATEAFVAEAESMGVEVSTTEATVQPLATIRGGQEYGINGSFLCSIGFNSVNASGAPVVVTAGHCTEGGTSFTFNGSSLGTPGTTSFPGDDYGTINTSGSHAPVAEVDTYDGSATPVTGSTPAAVGASLCKSGRTTDWTCGTVTGFSQTVNYGGGDVVSGLTEHTACVEQGDSGGSNMSGTQAQGVSSGGSLYDVGGSLVCGEKVGQPNAAYFQPVDEVLANEGLTLLTS